MPNGRTVNNKGTNSQGNEYTSYDRGYRYKNTNSDGSTNSRYYNDGSGHGFYEKKGPDGYKFHENANQGFRDYQSNQKK